MKKTLRHFNLFNTRNALRPKLFYLILNQKPKLSVQQLYFKSFENIVAALHKKNFLSAC